VLDELPQQNKIRMQHYVALHPSVVDAVTPFLDGRNRKDNTHKFAEQLDDVIQWDQSNRAYILTRGVPWVEWTHYRHPLPEYIYGIYMKYWKGVRFVW
jgi:hypothetical protein